MKHLVAQPHILMSVQDPYHPASSEISHEDAIGVLSGGGKYNNVHSAKGKYGNIQDTIFISNPSEAQVALAHKIAEETGQDSLIESDGHSHKMIVTNGPDKGSVTYGKGTTWHEQEPEDYYTTLPTGEHFTHNFDEVNQDVQKSEDLEKSKNVREQRAKVFGTDPNAPRISNKRMKMMQAIQGYAQKKYGLPLVTASGKRDVSGQLKEEKGIEQQPYDVFSPEGLAEEKARQEKVKQLGLKRVDPKPDWRSGNIETQPSPDAAVHDLAHLDLAPEGVTAPEMQDLMDRKWGESQKKYGHMQQKKIQGEIQPMALENPLRRELGLPANRTTKPVTENQTALDDPNQQRFVQGKDSKGRPAFYDRQSRLMNPETRERLTQIREGSVKFDPKGGWQPSSDVNALINLRGRGMAGEAQERAKQKFSPSVQSQPKKLASSEKMSKSEQLRKRCWEGYKAIPGKKPYSKGSCAPIYKGDSEKPFHGYNKEKHSKTGGLSDKYRKKYNRETGSNLKRPVTGKVKAGSEAAGRRKSFCARMSGVKGPTSKEGKLTPKGAALKRWKCSKSEELEKAKLEHYSSQQGLKSIDPKFKGRGVDIRTKGRDTEHPHSFFYRAGTLPEDVVASGAKSKYTVEIPDEMPLYDLATDSDGHIASAIEQNQGALNMDMVHQNLKDAGYQGFYNSAHPQLSNAVALYHEHPVSEEHEVQKQEGTDCDDHLDPLKKPYSSEAQRRWAHTEAGKKVLGGKKAVAHWDKASRGKDLPEKVKKKELIKGSFQRKNKLKISPEQFNNVKGWVNATSTYGQIPTEKQKQLRDNLPNFSEITNRLKQKLGKDTKIMRHPDTGEMMALLHRGVSSDEYHNSVENDRVNHKHKTSWTTNKVIAQDFARSNGSYNGQTISAWVPLSKIISAPYLIPAKLTGNGNKDELFQQAPRYEKEIIVDSDHNSFLTHDKFDPPEDTLGQKVKNYKQSKHMSRIIGRSLAASEKLEKVSREEVAQSHILMFPVSINGQHKDEHENIPDYHITLKWMGNNPHKTPEEIQNIVQKHGLMPPQSFDLHPHIFNTPNGPAHVLLLNGNLDSLHHAKREIDVGNPDRYPSYLPHITVSKKIHDAVKEHGLTAKDLNIQVHPLEYRVGEQTIKRYG
jgi:hypothetical protein